MKRKIVIRRLGVVHYHAICFDCDFSASGHTHDERAEVRAEVLKHVRATGHTCSIESGTATHYSKDGDA